MKVLFKKILLNMLVLMVVMLPLRDVLAGSMNMSSDVCSMDMADVEMTMIDHAGHDQSSMKSMSEQQDQEISTCTCCYQCDGDCSNCVQTSSVITFEFLNFTDSNNVALLAMVNDSLLTRTISPPSRPPLVL